MSESNNGFFINGDTIRVVHLSKWLDWAGGVNDEVFIALPMIQRGSVWKPHQIIDLWDTLLRGMPVGSLMAQTLRKDEKVRKVGGHELVDVPKGGGLSLLDGQQRTLSMLIPWGVSIDKKVWVDFGDKPQDEHLYRLRVTTENHPFGFQRSSPSSRLSLGDRNKARRAHDNVYQNDKGKENKEVFRNSKPWGSVFPIDLVELITLWKKYKDKDICTMTVLEKIKNDTNSEIEARIRSFYQSIERLFSLQIPIIKVGSEMFESDGDVEDGQSQGDIAPPLAVLFKRIGTGGTALTDADYVYSLIKYRLPEAYTLVEKLHEKHNTASLLSATNLVMSAVRIAAAEFNDSLPYGDKRRITDWESPSKRDFHSLLKRGEDFLEGRLKPLITVDTNEHGPLIDAFKALSDLLEYQKYNDIGLPKYAFPLLHRPLVQVLLRWIRQVQLHYPDDIKNICKDNRARVIRFVLYWRVFVLDAKDASRLAFDLLAKNESPKVFPDKIIYEKLVEKEERAICINTPDAIKHIAFSAEDAKLRGGRRFEIPKETSSEEKRKIKLYNCWWGHGRYVHPILLWLQRDLVSTFSGDPMAGRDEETPYDYDHICPSSYWFNNGKSDKNKDRIIDHLAEGDGHWRVGNSIGNVRVWGSSDNRSDGDDSPAEKILNRIDSRDILVQSAIDIESEQIAYWQKCSGDKGKGKVWDLSRAQAFQRAVEHRAFALYERYYTELGFDDWIETEVRTTSDSIAS